MRLMVKIIDAVKTLELKMSIKYLMDIKSSINFIWYDDAKNDF